MMKPAGNAKRGERKTQIEKFRDTARKHEADESEDAFNASLRAIATNKGPNWTKDGKRKLKSD